MNTTAPLTSEPLTDQVPLLAPPTASRSSSSSSNNNNNNNNEGTANNGRGYYQALANAIPDAPPSEMSLGSTDDHDEHGHAAAAAHLTTVPETLLHLVKGYIGPGMLSLPWAVSQIGVLSGFAAVFAMSYWSSYNCWTVVRVKRYIEQSRQGQDQDENNNNNNNNNTDAISETGSSVTTNTNITYPDVGEWAYGKTFQSYVSACICTQQLAICTVFISFIGENLMAVLKALPNLDWGFWQGHVGVMTLALPACLSLSFIPSLKGLAPVMAAGTFLLIATLIIMGYVGTKEWSDRPHWEELPTFALPKSPLALCAILYSYEGICLILPIESAMAKPKYFGPTFAASMAIVSLILATFSCCCVLAFGEVTNGSVTAFLIRHYDGNDDLVTWLLLANATISFSVLMTYPLQLFPAVELLGPSWSKVFGTQHTIVDVMVDEDEEEDVLAGFDPLPPLPEHDTFAEEEEFDQVHKYDGDFEQQDDKNSNSAGEPPSALTIDNIRGGGDNNENEETQSIRSFLSSAISFPNQMMPKMILPGDSPQLRAALVILTYSVAVVVPNVQALISLAGALAGSSSALLIPPVLELAWLNHLESGMAALNKAEAGGASGSASPSLTAMKLAAEANTRKNKNVQYRPYKYFWAKIKNYLLLVAGFIFMLIGTYASIADIVAIYTGHDKA